MILYCTHIQCIHAQMYTEYIANFENALKVLEESCKKNRAFEELVREFEVHTSIDMHTCVQGHLRVKRFVKTYRLVVTCWRLFRGFLDTSFSYKVRGIHSILIKYLTTDYLKHLPEDSNDRQDSESAFLNTTCIRVFY